MTDRQRNLACFAACAAAQLLAFVGGLVFDGAHFHARLDGDLKLYHAASAAVWQGQVPYRDFPLEYPPGALLPFVGPRLLGGADMSRPAYAIAFALQSALLSIACMFLAARIAARFPNTRLPPSPGTPGEGRGEGRAARATMVLFTLFTTLGWALIPYRFDLFPTLLTLAAVACAIDGRHATAGACLSLGVLAKLYPLVLAPVLFVHALRRSGRRAATRFAVALALATGALLLPFAALAGTGTFSFLTYHKERGIQIESVPGGVFCLAHVTGLSPVAVTYDHGALHLASPPARRVQGLLDQASPFAAFIGVSMLCLWSARHPDPDRALLVATTGSLLVFLLVNKVFSPQFLIWLLPFAAILRGRVARDFLLAWSLTLLVYPFLYAALRELSPMVVSLVNLRNGSVVALLGLVMAGHARPSSGRPGDRLSLPHEPHRRAAA